MTPAGFIISKRSLHLFVNHKVSQYQSGLVHQVPRTFSLHSRHLELGPSYFPHQASGPFPTSVIKDPTYANSTDLPSPALPRSLSCPKNLFCIVFPNFMPSWPSPMPTSKWCNPCFWWDPCPESPELQGQRKALESKPCHSLHMAPWPNHLTFPYL